MMKKPQSNFPNLNMVAFIYKPLSGGQCEVKRRGLAMSGQKPAVWES
jgi:hypothetical protein